MRRSGMIVSVAVVLISCGGVWAERCIGPMDNSSVAQSFGVAPITAADLTWCDDFDSYCSDNELADSRWPGYPPDPDNLCAEGSSRSTSWFTQPFHWPSQTTGAVMQPETVDPPRWEGWDGNPGWSTEPFVANYAGGGNSTQYHVFDMSAAIARKFPGFDAINGTDTTPLVLRYWMYHSLDGAPPNSPLYVELKLNEERAPTDYVVKDCLGYHDCTCAALNPEATCATGDCNTGACTTWYCGDNDTCEGGPNNGQPCVLSSDCLKTCVGGPHDGTTCSTNTDCGVCVNDPAQACDADADCGACVGGANPGGACDSNHDCQAGCLPEQQSTCDDGPKVGQVCQADSDCAAGPYLPIVNQQWLNGQIGGAGSPIPHPPLDTERTWSSIAFGMLAQLDRDPCDSETGRKPTMYHAATFDGNRWYDLRSSVFPGQGDFNYDWKQAFFEITVTTSNYQVKLVAGHYVNNVFTYVQNVATIPRKYTGPFNRIGMGTGPGCELDPATGQCLGPADVWDYATGSNGLNWHNGQIDRMAVLGGVPASTRGACCMPDGSCVEDTDSMTCNQAGGGFRGAQSTCAGQTCTGACCQGAVCSDTVKDACANFNFLGIGTSCLTDQCPCSDPFADADGDHDVDQADFAALQACYTGPVVGQTLSAACKCFDRSPTGGNDAIDSDDYSAFEACATGAGIAADPLCDGAP